jgi:hypothetical protein
MPPDDRNSGEVVSVLSAHSSWPARKSFDKSSPSVVVAAMFSQRLQGCEREPLSAVVVTSAAANQRMNPVVPPERRFPR